MEAQEKKELMNYIKAAIEIETEIATQENIIEDYNQNSLDREPELLEKKEPDRPIPPDNNILNPDILDGSPFLTVSFFLGSLTVILAIINIFNNLTNSLILLLIGIVLLTPRAIQYYNARKIAKQTSTQYQEQLTKYNTDLQEIRKYNESQRDIYQTSIREWQDNDNENRNFLQTQLSETKTLLQKLYEKEFIYEKYHNLPALTSIYEYFMIGRCDELTGPHGAYNLYEDEIRKDTVISQLNRVIENLEEIKQSQYMLYQQVKKISEDSSAISQEISTIRGYTARISELSAITAYYSSVTARNTSISAAYNLLNG